MKFYYFLNFSFLSLPILASTYFGSLNSQILEPFLPSEYNFSDLKKREEIECEFTKAFVKCKEAIQPDYSYCMKDYDRILTGQYNHRINCPYAMSDRCQELFKKGHTIKPECRDDILQGYVENEKKAFYVLSSFLSLICTKDEDDNYCAYNDIILEKEPVIQQYEKTLYSIVNSTCYSKSCTDSFTGFYDHVQEYLRVGREYMAVKSIFETQSSESKIMDVIESDVVEKINSGEINLKKKKLNNNNKLINETSTIDETDLKNTKRSFSIENMSSLQTYEIYNQTLNYLKSNECHNVYVKYMEEKDSEANNAYSTINSISIYIILYSLIYILL